MWRSSWVSSRSMKFQQTDGAPHTEVGIPIDGFERDLVGEIVTHFFHNAVFEFSKLIFFTETEAF